MTTNGALTGATSTGVDAKLSVVLCYLAWWVSGLIFLVIEQEHREVRFHAAQSILVFGGLSVIIFLLSTASMATLFIVPVMFEAAQFLASVVWVGAVVLWLIVMVKTLRGESWRIPFVADLAAKIAAK